MASGMCYLHVVVLYVEEPKHSSRSGYDLNDLGIWETTFAECRALEAAVVVLM